MPSFIQNQFQPMFHTVFFRKKKIIVQNAWLIMFTFLICKISFEGLSLS